MNPALLRVIFLVPGKIIEKIWGDLYGIQISRHANIGGGFKIAHFSGIFINSEVQIGDDVTVCQGTTVGIWGGTKSGAPSIGNNVYIGPGAKLFGKITIGNNVRIGANAVVFFDVPDNAIVYSPKPNVKIRDN